MMPECTCRRTETLTEHDPGCPVPDWRPAQSANGRPHLTYFEDGISFVWSGSLFEPIEVCPGGYGEPVTDRIPVSNDLATQLLATASLAGSVAAFGRICTDWLALDDTDDEPPDVGVLRDEAAAEANTDGRW